MMGAMKSLFATTARRLGPAGSAILVPGVLIVAMLLLALFAHNRPIVFMEKHADLNDSILYLRVADRVEAGVYYYDAAEQELQKLGFERGSTFHWRTPLYAHLLGKLGRPVQRQIALALLSLATSILVGVAMWRLLGIFSGLWSGLTVFASTAWWLYPESPCFTEVWAGLLILLTILFRSMGWPRLGFFTGTLGLFLRELVLPFVVVCLGDAWLRRRWSEAIAWSLCLSAYSVYFLMHEAQVASRQDPLLFYLPSSGPSWFEFGGVPFLLATTRMNYCLSLLPMWCTSIYLPLAVFGLASLCQIDFSGRGMLVGFGGYLVAFLVVGKSFNYYWGWITAPTLSLGFAVSPFFLSQITRSPRRATCSSAAGG